VTLVIPRGAGEDVESVKKRLALADHEIDPEFGVIEVDRDQRIFTVLVPVPTAERLSSTGLVEGSFANPPIEPFGPPEN
jgi:hypothetical protein